MEELINKSSEKKIEKSITTSESGQIHPSLRAYLAEGKLKLVVRSYFPGIKLTQATPTRKFAESSPMITIYNVDWDKEDAL